MGCDRPKLLMGAEKHTPLQIQLIAETIGTSLLNQVDPTRNFDLLLLKSTHIETVIFCHFPEFMSETLKNPNR